MPEKQRKKKDTLEPSSVNPLQNGIVPSLEEKTKKNANQRITEDVAGTGLLYMIASYLRKREFSKTLSAFLSEAQLKVDGWKVHSLDLEDLFCKHLEKSYHDELTVIDLKERDLQIKCFAGKSEESNYDASGKSSLSKKRKNRNGSDTHTETESNKIEVENMNLYLIPDPSQNLDKSLGESAKDVKDSAEMLLNGKSNDVNLKLKEKKKKIKSVLENIENSKELGASGDLNKIVAKEAKSDAEITNHEILSCGSPIKPKEKKHKKHKLFSGSHSENIEQVNPETNQEVAKDKSKELESWQADSRQPDILGAQSPIKSKEKKNKKHKLISDSDAENIIQASSETNKEVVKEKSKDLEFLQGANKSGSQQPESVSEAETLLEGAHFKSKEKKRKRKSNFEGLDDEIAEKAGLGRVQDGDKEVSTQKIKSDADNTDGEIPLGGTHVKSKEKKDNKHELISQENDEVVGQLHHTKRRKVDGNQTEIKECQQTEGERKEGSGSTKMMKKEDNVSSEPKTVSVFKRVKVDEVKFADERLQDNSYWAKSGADSGYGAKAQEVLGQVRGKDFRHEKTKKKRGSYRGGQIDLQTHSIKFNYSDDE